MKKEFELKVDEAIRLIYAIISMFGEFKLKRFASLPNQQQEDLICESISQFVVSSNNTKLVFRRNGSDIRIYCPVNATLIGTSIYNIDSVRRSITAEIPVVRLETPWIFEEEEISYEFAFPTDQERQEIVYDEDTKNLQDVRVMVSEDTVKSIKKLMDMEFVTKQLPKVIKPTGELVKAFFNVLNAHGLCEVTGTQSYSLFEVYLGLAEMYPQFRELSSQERGRLIDQIYEQTGDRTELVCFAQQAFMLMRQMQLDEEMTLEKRPYHKSREMFCNIHDDYMERPAGQLKMLVYQTTTLGRSKRTQVSVTFLPFDLWHSIAHLGNVKAIKIEEKAHAEAGAID